MKKIVIDARFYGHENGGLGRYTINLLKELSKIDLTNQYYILLRKAYFSKLELPENYHQVLVEARHYSFKEQISVPLTLRRINPDVTHFLHFNVPLLWRKSFIVTIHDLIMHSTKSQESTTLSFIPFLIKRFMYFLSFNHAVRTSKEIIVPSEFVKNELLKHYSVNAQKIAVMYEGIDEKIKYTTSKNVVDDLNITKPFFLYVGNAYPHKNLEIAVKAIVHLNESLGKKAQLLIVSPRDAFYERLQTLVKVLKAQKYVVLSGKVSDAQLSELMSHATAFVYPSLLEGFGLPALEAMSLGTPAIVSEIPVFKEVYKDAGIYFTPQLESELSSRMNEVLSMSTTDRKKFAAKVQTFTKQYSWKDMTKKIVSHY